MSNVLVVAPHPDDETLGCGGTLLRHREHGDTIHWLIMSKITPELGYSNEKIQKRDDEILRVAGAYGFKSHAKLDFCAAKLDTYPASEIIIQTSKIINEIQPEIIYLPYVCDVHSDHAVVFNALASCTKSFRYPYIRKVRVYETLSETEFSINPACPGFKPNLWVDVSDFLDKKIQIMMIYSSEIGTHPFPRSDVNIRALATFRGATAGVNAAEAFMSIKEIE